MTIIYSRWQSVLLGLMVCVVAQAYDFEDSGFYFNVVSAANGTCELTKGENAYSGNVVIPAVATFRGKTLTVTQIGDNTFQGNSTLTGVVIPENIEIISYHAFQNCTNLLSVTFPSTLKVIRCYAFSNCSGLKTAIFNEGLEEIWNEAFENCGLESVDLPNSLTKIESSFWGCQSLKEVVLPRYLEEVKGFHDCDNIVTVKIKNPNAPKMGIYPFSDKTYLNGTLYVPKNVLAVYQESPYWNKFFVIEEDETLGVVRNVKVRCSADGRVSVNNRYLGGSQYMADSTEFRGFENDVLDFTYKITYKDNWDLKHKARLKSLQVNSVECINDTLDGTFIYTVNEDTRVNFEFVRYRDLQIKAVGDSGTVSFNGITLHNDSTIVRADDNVPIVYEFTMPEAYEVGIDYEGRSYDSKTTYEDSYTENAPSYNTTFTFKRISREFYINCAGVGTVYFGDDFLENNGQYSAVGAYKYYLYGDTIPFKFTAGTGRYLSSFTVDDEERVSEVHNNAFDFIPVYRENRTYKIRATFSIGIPPNGIEDVVNESLTPYFIYGADGLSRQELQPGLNILKYANGKSKKVIIK